MVNLTRPSARMLLAAALLLVAMLPALLGADGDEKPPIQRLDPQTRGRVVLALAGLVLLLPTVVVLVWLGGRMARRYARGRSTSSEATKQWYEKPLVPPEEKGSDRPVE